MGNRLGNCQLVKPSHTKFEQISKVPNANVLDDEASIVGMESSSD